MGAQAKEGFLTLQTPFGMVWVFLDYAERPQAHPSPKATQSVHPGGLHGDGVVGVADHVPAGAIATVGEYGVAAGNIFLGMDGIDFIFHFVAPGGDGEQAYAMDRAGALSQFGKKNAEFIPGQVRQIEKNEERHEAEENAAGGKILCAMRNRCCGHPIM